MSRTATQHAALSAHAGLVERAQQTDDPCARWEAAIDAIPTDVLKALVTERSIADAAELYQREEHRMSKSSRQQKRAEARDGRSDAKWWKGRAAEEKAAGNTAAARAHRQHAANRLRDARRADPDR